MKNNIERMKQFIRLGFNDCSIDFKIREVNGKNIVELVKVVKDYNKLML